MTTPAPSSATASYPFAAYNFRVLLDDTILGFSDVTGLVQENDVVTYEHGMSFREGPRLTLRPSRAWSPVTLSRGSTLAVRDLTGWIADRRTRKLQVSLLDEVGKPKLTWVAERAVPVRLSAPHFDVTTNEVAIEALDLLVSGIRVDYS
jgi:phage tail-like protein